MDKIEQIVRDTIRGMRDGAVRDRLGVKGHVSYRLIGPDGKVKAAGETGNIVTDKGDALFSSLAYTAAPTFNIRLGKTATTPSKTYDNAGGFIPDADSEADGQQAMDSTYPKVGASANIAKFVTTFAAGDATATWNRAALVNSTESNPSDGTLTYAIALLPDKPVVKGALDTLEITWTITFLGA
jgi:hypothetical protein